MATLDVNTGRRNDYVRASFVMHLDQFDSPNPQRSVRLADILFERLAPWYRTDPRPLPAARLTSQPILNYM